MSMFSVKFILEDDFNFAGQSRTVERKTKWPKGEIRWPRTNGPLTSNGIPAQSDRIFPISSLFESFSKSSLFLLEAISLIILKPCTSERHLLSPWSILFTRLCLRIHHCSWGRYVYTDVTFTQMLYLRRHYVMLHLHRRYVNTDVTLTQTLHLHRRYVNTDVTFTHTLC